MTSQTTPWKTPRWHSRTPEAPTSTAIARMLCVSGTKVPPATAAPRTTQSRALGAPTVLSLARALMLALISTTLVTLLFTSVVHAHPFHITSAEAQINAKNRTLEVALELNPTELEQAMELRWNRDIDLDEADAESLVARYAEEVFKVISHDEPADFTWVGQELGIASGWLYFQFEDIDGLSSLIVENRFLVEVAQDNQSEQLNTIRFKDPSARGSAIRKLSLTFTPPKYRLTLDGPTLGAQNQ